MADIYLTNNAWGAFQAKTAAGFPKLKQYEGQLGSYAFVCGRGAKRIRNRQLAWPPDGAEDSPAHPWAIRWRSGIGTGTTLPRLPLTLKM